MKALTHRVAKLVGQSTGKQLVRMVSVSILATDPGLHAHEFVVPFCYDHRYFHTRAFRRECGFGCCTALARRDDDEIPYTIAFTRALVHRRSGSAHDILPLQQLLLLPPGKLLGAIIHWCDAKFLKSLL